MNTDSAPNQLFGAPSVISGLGLVEAGDFKRRRMRREIRQPHSEQMLDTFPLRSYPQRGQSLPMVALTFLPSKCAPHFRQTRLRGGYGFRNNGSPRIAASVQSRLARARFCPARRRFSALRTIRASSARHAGHLGWERFSLRTSWRIPDRSGFYKLGLARSRRRVGDLMLPGDGPTTVER